VITIIIIIIITSSFKVYTIHGLFWFRILTSELTNLFGHLVGLLGRGISPTQGLYLYREKHYTEKRGHTFMPRGGSLQLKPSLSHYLIQIVFSTHTGGLSSFEYFRITFSKCNTDGQIIFQKHTQKKFN
jgi:hypothetical protein